MTSDETRAVMNATKLMPCEPWPEPTLLVADGLGVLLAVADMVE